MPPFQRPQKQENGSAHPAPSNGAHTLKELLENGLIQAITPSLEKATSDHPVAVTRTLIDQIDRTNPNDPVARQFVPSEEETIAGTSDLPDPIGDLSHAPVRGIIHRYPDRLLLNLTYTCPAYCRFCFRRGRVGSSHEMLSEDALAKALDYIRSHKNIREVILSGGEPLILSPRRLNHVLTELNSIAHIRNVRIHSRLPISNPEKITQDIVGLLTNNAKPVKILVHCNHPNELGTAARTALRVLSDAGIPLLSQSVLLRDVNDNVETLAALVRAFTECNLTPHYIHHPDRAKGTRHFTLPLQTGIDLMRASQEQNPTLLIPTYILEIPGGHGKVRVLSDDVRKTKDGYALRSFKGEWFAYTDA